MERSPPLTRCSRSYHPCPVMLAYSTDRVLMMLPLPLFLYQGKETAGGLPQMARRQSPSKEGVPAVFGGTCCDEGDWRAHQRTGTWRLWRNRRFDRGRTRRGCVDRRRGSCAQCIGQRRRATPPFSYSLKRLVSKKLVSYICRASLVHHAGVRCGRNDAAEASPLRTSGFVQSTRRRVGGYFRRTRYLYFLPHKP